MCISDEGSQSINDVSYAGRFKIGISNCDTPDTRRHRSYSVFNCFFWLSSYLTDNTVCLSYTDQSCPQISLSLSLTHTHTHTHTKPVRLHTKSNVYFCFCFSCTSTKFEMCRQILAKVPNPDTRGWTDRNAAANIRLLYLTDTPTTKFSRCSTGWLVSTSAQNTKWLNP